MVENQKKKYRVMFDPIGWLRVNDCGSTDVREIRPKHFKAIPSHV